MSEMVERAARAILREGNFSENADTIEFAMRYARAAIEALREPTKAMEEAGEDLDDWGVPSDPGSGNACALAHWHAMIDEVLR